MTHPQKAHKQRGTVVNKQIIFTLIYTLLFLSGVLGVYFGSNFYSASTLVKEGDALMINRGLDTAIEKYTLATTKWSPRSYKTNVLNPKLDYALATREELTNFNRGREYFQNKKWKEAALILGRISEKSIYYDESTGMVKESIDNLIKSYEKESTIKTSTIQYEDQTQTYIREISEVVNEYISWGENIPSTFPKITENIRNGNYGPVIESLTAQSNRFRSMFLSASGVIPPNELSSAHSHFIQALINSHVWLSMWADSITELKYGNAEKSQDSMSQANAYKTEAQNEMGSFQTTWNKIKPR